MRIRPAFTSSNRSFLSASLSASWMNAISDFGTPLSSNFVRTSS